MSLFGKKKAKTPSTIQEVQQEFNQLMFQLGTIAYQKYMKRSELTQAENAINEIYKRADKLGQDAQRLAEKARTEVNNTVKAGEAVSAAKA